MTTTSRRRRPPWALPGLFRRHRSTLLIGLALVAAVAIAIVLGTGTQTSTPMDPDNPGPAGARALAQVLGDEGVDVQVARSADELEAIDVDGDTSVVVVLPEYLGTSTIERLRDHTGEAHTVIVVGAGPGVADALGELGGGASIPQARAASPAATTRGSTGSPSRSTSRPSYPDGDCFHGKSGALVTDPAEGLPLFGADQALANDQILRADNAAVALRLLGEDDRLVWYVPSIDDLVGDDGVSLQTLLPRWVRPGLVLLAIVMVTVILWRARRLGALATEPLPVVVRAVETTRSLGLAAPPFGRPRPRGGGAAPRRALPARRAASTRPPPPHPTSWRARWPGAPAAPRRTSWPSSARPASYRPPTAT